MKAFVIAVVAVILSSFAVGAQQICGYCVEASAFFACESSPQRNCSPQLLLPVNATTLFKKDHVYFTRDTNVAIGDYVRSRHVCKGTVTEVPVSLFRRNNDTNNNVFQLPIITEAADAKGRWPLNLKNVGVCDGTLVDIDEYRKEVAQKLIIEELRRVQSLVNEDAVRGHLSTGLKAEFDQRQETLIAAIVERLKQPK